jgi:hypothetical protein
MHVDHLPSRCTRGIANGIDNSSPALLVSQDDGGLHPSRAQSGNEHGGHSGNGQDSSSGFINFPLRVETPNSNAASAMRGKRQKQANCQAGDDDHEIAKLLRARAHQHLLRRAS